MPADLLARGEGDSLRAVNDRARAAFAKYNGKIIKVTVVQPRNAGHLRRYWKLIDLVFENLPHDSRIKDRDELHIQVKLMTGARRRVMLPTDLRDEYGAIILPAGTVCFEPMSIAFDNMTDETFDRFFDRVCDLIATYYLPTVTIDWLRHQVARLIKLEDEPNR